MSDTSTEVAVHTGGALAISGEQTAWTDQQLAVLRSAGVKKEVTPAELTAFLHEAQRTGLDPFTKQIYLIGRWDAREKREVYRSQTGIDGYRVVAHRAARRDGVRLGYDDTLWCGADGEWRDVWLSSAPPAAAKVTVYRDRQAFSAVATLAEYAARNKDGDPTPMWRRMPSTMLAKCAEALALRKAFPHDLSGLYTAEEMEQADNGRAQRPPEVTVDQAVGQMRRNHPQAPAEDEWTTEAVAGAADVDTQRPTTRRLQQIAMLVTRKFGTLNRDERLAHLSGLAGRELRSTRDLSAAEARSLADKLELLPDHVADAEVVEDAEPLPSVPNGRDMTSETVPGWSEALSEAAVARLVSDAAEANVSVDHLLYTRITAAATQADLSELFKLANEALAKGHISDEDFASLDELGRAANEDLRAGRRRPASGWSHDRLAQMAGTAAES